MGNQYWLEGKVSIPEEKRDIFNENVLKLLDCGGIRKLKEIELDKKIITVACKPTPDDKGIVRFDYSIFENRKRGEFYYDMNTCELSSTDCGYEEFCLIMNAVMVMQEAYSTEHCYFMCGDEICDVYGYALLVEELIGLKLTFTNREKPWNMLVYFKSNEKYNAITYGEIRDKFPYGYGDLDIEQLIVCFVSSEEYAGKPENYVRLKKTEIKHAKMRNRIYHAYELFQELLGGGRHEDTKKFLKNLLDLNLAEREVIAGQDDIFGSLAEITLYELPACIVAAYGWAAQEEFWNLWFSLEIEGYQDVYGNDDDEKEKEEEKQEKERMFYKVIRRDNEDEFLEFWDNRQLYLSDDMKENLEEWKHDFMRADGAGGICVETYLADILLELRDIWDCRYVDEELIKDFMEHTDDIRFKKALMVFRQLLDSDLEYFPELTAGQVKEWVVKQYRYRRSEDRIELSGYAALLTNRARRFELLEF